MTARHIRTAPLAWLAVGFLLLLALAACKSDAQLEAERATLDSTPLPTATIAAATAATPGVSEPVTEVATAGTPQVRYVANTGGDGISLRSDCRTNARIPGAWAEGTRVDVIETGSGECDGWSLATADSTETWVNNRYLDSTSPSRVVRTGTTPSATPGPSGSSPTPTVTAPPPPASTVPGQFSVASWWFTSGEIGQKVLNISVRNDSSETLDQYIVDICILDDQGNEIKEHGHGFSCFRWSDLDVSIAPGAIFTPDKTWRLHACPGVTSVAISPVFSHTTGDNFWRL